VFRAYPGKWQALVETPNGTCEILQVVSDLNSSFVVDQSKLRDIRPNRGRGLHHFIFALLYISTQLWWPSHEQNFPSSFSNITSHVLMMVAIKTTTTTIMMMMMDDYDDDDDDDDVDVDDIANSPWLVKRYITRDITDSPNILKLGIRPEAFTSRRFKTCEQAENFSYPQSPSPAPSPCLNHPRPLPPLAHN
jgi:hypothetical protein